MPASPAGSSPPRGTSPTERPASHAASRAASRAASGAATPAEERCWMDDPFAEGAAAPSSRPRSRAEPGFNLLGALDDYPYPNSNPNPNPASNPDLNSDAP